MDEVTINSEGTLSIAHLLKQMNLTQSTSESMRMVKQGAVKINGEKVEDPALIISNREHIYNTSREAQNSKVHLQ